MRIANLVRADRFKEEYQDRYSTPSPPVSTSIAAQAFLMMLVLCLSPRLIYMPQDTLRDRWVQDPINAPLGSACAGARTTMVVWGGGSGLLAHMLANALPQQSVLSVEGLSMFQDRQYERYGGHEEGRERARRERKR